MSTYRITFEIALKDNSIERSDFIYDIVRQAMESGEYLYNYHVEDINDIRE